MYSQMGRMLVALVMFMAVIIYGAQKEQLAEVASLAALAGTLLVFLQLLKERDERLRKK